MRRVGSLLLVALAFGGCGTRALPETTSEVPDCDARVVDRNLCPGAPPVVCQGTCAVDPDCATTLEVPGPAEVDRLRAAPRGACARLGDGDYPALSIEDVSLYGAGEARVRLRGLEVNSTERVRIRGLLVGAQGVSVRGTGEVVLQGVRVLGATGTSVHATPTVRLALDRVTIEDGGGFGLMRECSTGGALVDVTLTHVRVVNTRGAGLLLCDAATSLRGVLVDRTLAKDFVHGRAIDLQGGTLSATATLLSNGTEAGLVASSLVATLGPGFYVDGHQPGVVLGKASQASLNEFAIKGARGAGLVVGTSGRAVVSKGSIDAVALVAVPSGAGGVAQIGDCIEAAGSAHVEVAPDVFLSGCARRPAVLDTANTGRFLARLRGPDPAHPVVLQGDGPTSIVLAPDLVVEKRPRAAALPLLATP
ncbi:MAG: right-handed parallel beta-helix repeat-containing protein [Myxococcales bacterium]|nr:right-handed parallel beta-helix repeat-containing protein [Myxococcales bacterium]